MASSNFRTFSQIQMETPMSRLRKRLTPLAALLAATTLLAAACSSSSTSTTSSTAPDNSSSAATGGSAAAASSPNAGGSAAAPSSANSPAGSAAPASTAGGGTYDPKAFAGQTITLETYSTVDEFDFYKKQMGDFTNKTGIKVNFVQLPVAAMDQKIPLQLSAKDTGLDVFFTGSEKITAFVGSGGAESLDSYVNDPKQTDPTYNFKDVAPAVEAACQQGGKTYCIPSHTGGAVLYYNTKMFSEAGISGPPTTPAQLLADAQKLNTPAHAGFCVRADKSQTLYSGFQLWNWFVPWNNPITGTYFDKKWNFLIGTEPQASNFGNFYRTLLTTAAPKGIATYLVTNCLQDFQQSRVAMWQDDSGTIPQVLDPDESKAAQDTKFAAMPCQPVNPDHCSLVQPFGIWMNAASQHKGAAWQLIQYLTSAATQNAAVAAKVLLTPSRLSVVANPATSAVLPPTFATALTYILAHPDVALLPFINEGVAIIPPISTGLSDLITTQDPVANVMAKMKAGVDATMKAAGYPKPFPTS
jgi:ABC-type glycerol-3-phosphate transport system substrate-binding protein